MFRKGGWLVSANGVWLGVSDGHSDLDVAATGMGMSPVFQPIVALSSRLTVGFEALARWRAHPHLGPQSVFAHAEATRRVTQLDRLCIDRAVAGALRGGLGDGALLGVNSEPASDYTGRADSEVLRRGHDKFALIFELTERNLLDHLPILLRKVAALRADGIAIALDDVGANPQSLALLDIVRPDVIKLAKTLVQATPNSDTARIVAAIMAYRERRQTLVIAEGIENDQHYEQALAWGATLGQGYLFGRPGPLPLHLSTAAWSAPTVSTRAQPTYGTPFDVVANNPSVRVASKRTLAALSMHLEEQAHTSTDTLLVLTALQDGRRFGRATQDRYAQLAARHPLVAVFGRDLMASHPPGVRVVEFGSRDELCAQWVVLVLGAHTAAALVARERRGDRGNAEDDRRFDFVLTHDRSTVTSVALALLSRVS